MTGPGRKEQLAGQPGETGTAQGELTRHFSLFIRGFRLGGSPSRAETMNLAQAFDTVTQLPDPEKRIQAFYQLFETMAEMYRNTPDSLADGRVNGNYPGSRRWTGR